MAGLLRLPHGLLRRYLSGFERALVSLWLAAILYFLMHAVPVYPMYWDVFIAGVIFLAALRFPAVAYFLALLAATYPLTSISIYLGVLFIAVAVLGQRLFINHLGATLLVLSTPFLSIFGLSWVVPVLAGLWWGVNPGIIMGGLSALWGQLAIGMSGFPADWLVALSTQPKIDLIVERFSLADSLETLQLLITPFTPDSTHLLYSLLQIAMWAAIGGAAGALINKPWMQNYRPIGPLIIAMTGVLTLCLAHISLGLVLGEYTWESLRPLQIGIAVTTVNSALCTILLEAGRDFIEHPLPPSRRIKQTVAIEKTTPSQQEHQRRGEIKLPEEMDQKKPKDDDEDDLIMLELD